MPVSQITFHLLQEHIHLDERRFLALKLRGRLRLRLDGGNGSTPGAHRFGGGFLDKVARKTVSRETGSLKGIFVSHTTLGDIRFDRDIRAQRRRTRHPKGGIHPERSPWRRERRAVTVRGIVILVATVAIIAVDAFDRDRLGFGCRTGGERVLDVLLLLGMHCMDRGESCSHLLIRHCNDFPFDDRPLHVVRREVPGAFEPQLLAIERCEGGTPNGSAPRARSRMHSSLYVRLPVTDQIFLVFFGFSLLGLRFGCAVLVVDVYREIYWVFKSFWVR